MRLLFVSIAIAIALVAPRAAADPKPAEAMSLADVLAVAVRQAPELERATLDLETARATLQRAIGAEDIKVTATAQYQKNSVPGQYLFSEGGTLDLGRNLPTGGSIHVTASSLKTDQIFGGVTFLDGVQTGVQLSIVQPLLRGFGTRVARQPRYEAEHRRDAAAASREARARNLVQQIVTGYWQVALARATLDVRRSSLALAEQQRTYTENSIKVGKIPKSELLAMEQIIAIRKQDVALAELDITTRSLDLRRLAGLDIGADALDVVTADLPQQAGTDVDLRAAVALALERNADLLAFVHAERAAATRVPAAENSLLPNLDVGAQAGPIGFATTWTGSLDSLARGDGYNVGVTLTAIYDIGANDAHGQVRQARADALQARVDVRAGRAQVAALAARAVQLARAARARVELGDLAIDLAQQNIEAEQHRFEDRKSTNFDIIRRQDELEQAKLRRLAAVADFLSARAALDALTGAILTEYGIRLP